MTCSKLGEELSFNFALIVTLLHWKPQDWQRSDFKDSIDIAISCFPLGQSMG
ncbi:MAG TPA: hypothetical protein VEP30_00955 [Chthoniobacterales bacterium]|nr:hypothetical protein [Chthoniobacterales bacterium]